MIRNRDAASPANLSLDTLTSTEIASYRSGAWLPSRELIGGHRTRDETALIAELSARSLIAWEQLDAERRAS